MQGHILCREAHVCVQLLWRDADGGEVLALSCQWSLCSYIFKAIASSRQEAALSKVPRQATTTKTRTCQ